MSEQGRIERVIASTPLDKTAARVLGGGTHFTPKMKPGGPEHLENCPPIAPAPDTSGRFGVPIIGRKFGRFTVVGFAAVQLNPKKNARWVVRCVCGRYEFRKARAIFNATNTEDCCRECRALKHSRDAYARLGSRGAEEFGTHSAQAGETRSAEPRLGLGPKGEHAVANGDAPVTSSLPPRAPPPEPVS